MARAATTRAALSARAYAAPSGPTGAGRRARTRVRAEQHASSWRAPYRRVSRASRVVFEIFIFYLARHCRDGFLVFGRPAGRAPARPVFATCRKDWGPETGGLRPPVRYGCGGGRPGRGQVTRRVHTRQRGPRCARVGDRDGHGRRPGRALSATAGDTTGQRGPRCDRVGDRGGHGRRPGRARSATAGDTTGQRSSTSRRVVRPR